ncbi:hypothetical protein JQ604_30425 [Bradyrhizobium jicamae]|uniref:hypothetical protein n=1 Tax=Bradyrhizobium jicamae TaxID=280332 RepID=UPI001BA96C4F|nr:hypothetical protein [Bradyrhizobium jicamae]MBR0756516.1 hypothetical protein [Bradyrhizobium jicamae]
MEMDMKMDELNMKPHELSLDELDNTSGGFIWIAAVVGGFAAGTALRMGFDWAVKKLF